MPPEPVSVVSVLVVVAVVNVAVFAVERWYVLPLHVPSASMEPALVEGDWAIIDRRAYRHQPPGAGDVLMVKDPRLPERTLVKRAAGRDGASTRVIGDNAAQSTDSRVFGAVPDELLVGRVRWRYWPLRRFGRVA